MEVCLFLIGQGDDGSRALSDSDVSSISRASREVNGLRRLVMHRRLEAANGDPMLKAPLNAPLCVLQWYFDDLDQLESALQRGGAIQSVLDGWRYAAPGHPMFVQQVMAVRKFATPNPDVSSQSSERCTYLVSYEGEAQDFNAWLTHYMSHHPPLMVQLPGIRELEIYTRIDYRTGLAVPRAAAMQRNKVVFDHPSALAAALASPVRARMKHDFDAFPPYGGTAPHYPMHSIYGNLPGR